MTDIKNSFKTAGYDKLTRPSLAEAQKQSTAGNCMNAAPEQVTTQFYIDYLQVDQKSLDYTLEGFFRAWWKDSRLKFNGTKNGGCVDKVIYADASEIWTPDFYYEKAASISLAPAGNGQMLTVSDEGDVFWSRQSRIKLRCKMHFGNIPFDTQRCTYTLGLYSQLAHEVVLTWKPNSNPAKGPNALDNWKASSTAVWTVTLKEADVVDDLQQYSSGNYSYAIATLTFDRRAQGYVLSYIALSFFFVAMSYTGFYINPAATPGRVALAVITVLVVSGLLQSAKAQLPPFAYNTWLTDFMFLSLIFNMIGFFEMAAVNFGMTINAKCEKAEAASAAKKPTGLVSVPADALAKVPAKEAGADGGDPDQEMESGAKTIGISPFTGLMPRPEVSLRERGIKLVRSMKDMDHTMRWLFPICYFIFVLIMISQVGNYNPPE